MSIDPRDSLRLEKELRRGVAILRESIADENPEAVNKYKQGAIIDQRRDESQSIVEVLEENIKILNELFREQKINDMNSIYLTELLMDIARRKSIVKLLSSFMKLFGKELSDVLNEPKVVEADIPTDRGYIHVRYEATGKDLLEFLTLIDLLRNPEMREKLLKYYKKRKVSITEEDLNDLSKRLEEGVRSTSGDRLAFYIYLKETLSEQTKYKPLFNLVSSFSTRVFEFKEMRLNVIKKRGLRQNKQ